ncbi:MAG: nuclear transport factor 2 family protein [Bacteroidota bacterium]
MKNSIYILILSLFAMVSCQPQEAEKEVAQAPKPTREVVDAVLDDWHKAAADADFERYFGHFEDSTSIFMGTDATERWTVAEFKPWSKPYFDRGRAWSFTPKNRFVYFAEDGKTAWFDEELDTPNLGPSRGTGVLRKNGEAWKIAHYNLTVPIPNDLVYKIVPMIDSVLNKTQ